jgi:hypothetical protein
VRVEAEPYDVEIGRGRPDWEVGMGVGELPRCSSWSRFVEEGRRLGLDVVNVPVPGRMPVRWRLIVDWYVPIPDPGVGVGASRFREVVEGCERITVDGVALTDLTLATILVGARPCFTR